jgi:hypothetical protein
LFEKGRIRRYRRRLEPRTQLSQKDLIKIHFRRTMSQSSRSHALTIKYFFPKPLLIIDASPKARYEATPRESKPEPPPQQMDFPFDPLSAPSNMTLPMPQGNVVDWDMQD